MSDPTGGVRRVTFTLSRYDIELLHEIARWRHEHDPRAASLTVRELIREAHERERQKRERSGK